MCARMPNLRVLKLEMGHRPGTKRQRLWPKDWDGSFPWRDLHTLAVTYPDPDDEVYAHLPDTLHTLTVRCHPRHYIFMNEQDCQFITRLTGWTSPILTSTEMLTILRRYPTPNRLRDLDLEFMSDGLHADLELLRHISAAFPGLTFLQILGYARLPDEPTLSTVGSLCSSVWVYS
ncbi:hypothetical protein BN946_scf185033.g31 [Trametes cinnabarina]|uniref:F-box domain-containing protein n=1 Tax=Pycnoporus cinnabarinus TaxID=5643 RepID=A0A060SXA3_PYCCI|nr:hypothetical protein BN946_scf185033.g31 [Trametes cinnabarina]